MRPGYMREFIESALPMGKVEQDLRALLIEAEWQVELNERKVCIDPHEPLEVVARSAHTYEYDIGFRDHFRALVAIGGATRTSYGTLEAKICFVTLWYTAIGHLITIDVSAEMP